MLDDAVVIIDGAGNTKNLSAFKREDLKLVPGNITMDFFTFLQLRGKAFTTCEFIQLASGAFKQVLITPPPLVGDDPVLVFYNVQGTKEGKVSFLPDATAVVGNPIMLTNLNGLASDTPKSVFNQTAGATSLSRIRHGRFGGGKNPGTMVLSTGYIPKYGEPLVLEIESEEATNNIAYEILIFELNGVVKKD